MKKVKPSREEQYKSERVHRFVVEELNRPSLFTALGVDDVALRLAVDIGNGATSNEV